MSYGLPESTPQLREQLNDTISAVVAVRSPLIAHPYFLGGHPSAADYAIMGAMHAHWARPAGLRMTHLRSQVSLG